MATKEKSAKTKIQNKKVAKPSPKSAGKHKLYLSQNAIEILEKRYLKKKDDDTPAEKPEDMFWRVAEFLAQADANFGKSKEEVKETAIEFYNLMVDLDFFPNSPTLRGAGRSIHQLSACFVLPIEDTMEGIFDALKNMALIHKGGGGTGFSFGRLRPAGAGVGSTKGVAGGPLSFMQIFNTVGGELMQGGTRVGANMGILPVTHPDILDFIDAKQDNKSYQNFNLSVAVTDEFMEKVEKNEDYDLINPKGKRKAGKLNAKEVFEKMVSNAWKNGDPGVVFIDKINKDNATPKIAEIESTNPCGEQPLLPYESCNLGSINLSNMLKGNEIDWDHMKEVIHKAVHFLDNVIESNEYVVPQIEEITKGNRKIGLGVMGWADMIIRLGIPYNSDEAIKLAEKVMKFVRDESHKASRGLAQTRGVFPNWEKSIWKDKNIKMRNAAVTTIAPTGTLSMIGNCSGGIEPLFAVAYSKKSLYTKDGTAKVEQFFVNPLFEYYAKKDKFWSDELIKKVAKTNSIQDIEEIPEKYRKAFVTSHDIPPEWHIRMQAAFQKYTENAVSKTINFPKDATIDDVRKTYLLSYKLGCKGITIYRDGSKDMQVFTTESTYKEKEGEKVAEEPAKRNLTPRARPKVTRGITEKVKTGCGNLYVTINFDDFGPFEVFTAMGKAGGCASSQLESLSRILSFSLRAGLPVEEIIEQMRSIRCPSPIWQDGELILSCSDAISKVLEHHFKTEQPNLFGNGGDREATLKLEEEKKEEKQVFLHDLATKQPGEKITGGSKTMATCPDCGASLEHKEGCLLCNVCGFSKCG